MRPLESNTTQTDLKGAYGFVAAFIAVFMLFVSASSLAGSVGGSCETDLRGAEDVCSGNSVNRDLQNSLDELNNYEAERDEAGKLTCSAASEGSKRTKAVAEKLSQECQNKIELCQTTCAQEKADHTEAADKFSEEAAKPAQNDAEKAQREESAKKSHEAQAKAKKADQGLKSCTEKPQQNLKKIDESIEQLDANIAKTDDCAKKTENKDEEPGDEKPGKGNKGPGGKKGGSKDPKDAGNKPGGDQQQQPQQQPQGEQPPQATQSPPPVAAPVAGSLPKLPDDPPKPKLASVYSSPTVSTGSRAPAARSGGAVNEVPSAGGSNNSPISTRGSGGGGGSSSFGGSGETRGKTASQQAAAVAKGTVSVGGMEGGGGGGGGGRSASGHMPEALPYGVKQKINALSGMSVKAVDGITGPMGASLFEKVSTQYRRQKAIMIQDL